MVFLFIGLNKHIFKITGADLTTHGASISKKMFGLAYTTPFLKHNFLNSDFRFIVRDTSFQKLEIVSNYFVTLNPTNKSS
jgi:hypothetical protein